MTNIEQLSEKTEKAYLTALNAMINLVNTIKDERNYYREQCDQKKSV